MPELARAARVDRDRIYGGHALLAFTMIAWHVLENTPGVSSEHGGSFDTSTAGRAVALASILAGLSALAAVVVLSLRHWRDAQITALLVLLALSMSMRASIDVFDLVYLAATAILSVVWFTFERRSAASRATPTPPSR